MPAAPRLAPRPTTRTRDARTWTAQSLAVLLVAGVLSMLGTTPASAVPVPTTLTVTSTSDATAVPAACATSTVLTAPDPAAVSLREAVCLANNIGGTVVIAIPSGRYVLRHGSLQVGLRAGQDVTLRGAGSATTTIDAAGASRVLDLDSQIVGNVRTTVSGLTITGGVDDEYGGAGIIGGSSNQASPDALTIVDSLVTGNRANPNTPTVTNRPGGGVQFVGGSLTITDSRITANSSASSPGAGVAYQATGTTPQERLTISGSTLSGNTMTSGNGSSVSNGGALDVAGPASMTATVTDSRFVDNTVVATTGGAAGAAIRQQSGTLTISRSTFTGNTVTGTNARGGAIAVVTGRTTVRHNRITGNSAPSGSAIHVAAAAGAVDARLNWFGCNAGPGQAGCDTVAGTATVAPRLVLSASADPSAVVGPGGTSTISGSMTRDSAGDTVAPADLSAFTGLVVAMSDPQPAPATVADPRPTFSAGVAGTTYSSQDAGGPGHVRVTLDNQTVTVPLDVTVPPTVRSGPADVRADVGETATFAVSAIGYPVPTIQWQESRDGGDTFTDVPGAGAAVLTIPVTASVHDRRYRARLTSSLGTATSRAATLTVAGVARFTSPDSASFVAGDRGTFEVTTSGLPAVTAIRSSGTLPAGLALTDHGDGTATVSGTPAAGSGGTYPITLTADNGIGSGGTQVLTITVTEAPSVTTAPADQTVNPGTSVTFTAAASGHPTPTVRWQRSTDGGATYVDIAGATSPVLTVSSPTRGDDGNRYRAIFTSSAGTATSRAATLRVGSAPAFSSSNATTFLAGSAGTFTVTASGIPDATLTSTGSLPTWLTLTDAGSGRGTLTGTPPAGSGGTYAFTLRAANGFDPSASQAFTLTVHEAPRFTSDAAVTFSEGVARTFTIVTSPGFPTTTSMGVSGLLPRGISVADNGDGTARLTGTPAAGTAGVYPLTLTSRASGGTAPERTQSFVLTVHGPPVITSADHARFVAGAAGSFTVRTTPGRPTTTTLTHVGALPDGVTFVDNGDGTATISGTPGATTGGSFPLTITAANAAASVTQSFELEVALVPVITSADRATLVAGTSDAFTVTTSPGHPRSTDLTVTGTLPSGVTFVDNGDGTATLGGTPAAGTGGTYELTVTATNASGHSQQDLTLTVRESPVVSSVDHATFRAGAAGSFTITTGRGFPSRPDLSRSGRLPDGVTWTDNGDGTATISGTPGTGTGGTYALTITADNGVTTPRTQAFVLTVQEAPAVTSADHTTLGVGVAGDFTVTTRGFPSPTLTVTGDLPAGMTFTDAGDGTGTLAGTPEPGTAGAHRVTLTASNSVDSVSQTFTLTISKAPQAITVTSEPPTDAVVGDTYALAAVAGSGQPVAFSIDDATTGSACSLAGSTVSFVHAGTCVIDFDQAGDALHLPAPQVQQTVVVSRIATTLGVVTTPATTVTGQEVRATARVTAASGEVAGTVSFTVDGTPVGDPVPVSGGTATSGVLPAVATAPGARIVGATFTPTDTTTYAGATGTVSHVVSSAATTTTLEVRGDSIVATVTPVAPGAGSPSGGVTFTVGGDEVGTAPLVGGVATLTHTVPPGATRQLAATYAGDTSFSGSSASTARHDPTITAKVTSASARTKHGWYRRPVTITFTCTTNGSPLADGCPAPVTVTRRGAGRSVTASVTAVDGGAATVVVSGINIDDVRPSVRAKGVTNKKVYQGKAPRIRCVATDSLSGVASCTVSRRTKGSTTTYRVTATDKAGNVRTRTGSYRVETLGLQGVRFSDGAYQVRRGRTYTLVAHGSKRPTYYAAELAPRTPHVRLASMRKAGHHRWTLGVTMSGMRPGTWNLGIKTGGKMQVVRVRVR